MPFSDSPNARSKSITTAELDTYGVLNRHAAKNPAYQVGVSEDKGARRTMEDAHSFVVDFGGVRGQGFFAVFDGHAGKHAAEWCGCHFTKSIGDTPILACHSPPAPIPDVLNQTFHDVDESLSRMCEESAGKYIQDVPPSPRSSVSRMQTASSPFLPASQDSDGNGKSAAEGASIAIPPSAARRVLYCANAGDARGVLCRAGKAVRLTYDHKGSDKQEAKRITDAGGFVMSGRVNGVLAVTRSLGDSSMKEFVVGAPYTTETELCDEDEFLILACDGLWDVTSDQAAVDLIRDVEDAQVASQMLLKDALANHTSDNITVLVVRFKNSPPRTA
ncbi:phosphatase 2C-like domain-containing protein [Mycena haematopus]|nr:phosphatase 2C-like domain-containing protein [Mycena haematopus]